MIPNEQHAKVRVLFEDAQDWEYFDPTGKQLDTYSLKIVSKGMNTCLESYEETKYQDECEPIEQPLPKQMPTEVIVPKSKALTEKKYAAYSREIRADLLEAFKSEWFEPGVSFGEGYKSSPGTMNIKRLTIDPSKSWHYIKPQEHQAPRTFLWSEAHLGRMYAYDISPIFWNCFFEQGCTLKAARSAKLYHIQDASGLYKTCKKEFFGFPYADVDWDSVKKGKNWVEIDESKRQRWEKKMVEVQQKWEESVAHLSRYDEYQEIYKQIDSSL